MYFDDVNVEWVSNELNRFVSETKPVGRKNSTYTSPACGRDAAIALSESVRIILNKLYPQWQSENQTSNVDEFKPERDASKRLLARLARQGEIEANLGGGDTSPRISAASLHPLIWKAAEAQWSTGHRHEAVLAAAKAVNSHLQTKVGRRDISEVDLVRQAFSEKEPEPARARLRFSHIVDEQTRSSMRQGAMDFGAGCFAAIRNPVGHRPNEEIDLTEQSALERLSALSLLARWVDEADLVEAERIHD